MLYERWQKIVQEHRDEIALHDLSRHQHWTFGQLQTLAEQGKAGDETVVFPQGISANFVFSVLRAWRHRQVVCPLEEGQPAPRFDALPPCCVHLKMTSASTGVARVVAFRAEQLIADADQIVATMGLRRDWPNLGVISLAHSYGFSNLILPLLLHGIPLVIAESALPESVRQSSQNFPAMTLAAVPALWRAWSDAKAIPSNVRLAISAGAPLPIKLEQEIFASTGIKIHNFYGSTECGGIAYDSTEQPRNDGTCVGSPMQNVGLSVGPDGCLEVCSRAVAETYWPDPSDVVGNGKFRTSDLVELREGSVYLRGRASDQINVAGRKISPEAIERTLLTCPGISDCLVFGVPSKDAERSEDIVACVATTNADTDALKNFLLAKIPAWQMPRDWWVVESLQVNGRGKLSRAVWREKYLRSR